MLKLGIIVTVTGFVVLAHYFSGAKGALPRRAERIAAILFIVVGVPLLLVAAIKG